MFTGTGPVVVIVDGYSSANFLPAAFRRHGCDVIHVQSSAELRPAMIPPDLSEYADNIVCADLADVDTTVERLARCHPVAVLAGQEPGVLLADLLSERLGVTTNGTALSPARRDKYRMIETLRAAGLPCAKQYKSGDPRELAAWARRLGDWPVVLKPLASSSSDHVFICRTPDEVSDSARQLLGTIDMFGTRNTEALVQSFLEGTEYCVDTVGVDGDFFVCGIWKYEKVPVGPWRRIYDRDVLQNPGDAGMPEIIAYLGQVLAVLGIRNGPAHTEIMLTADGPVLVEVGARVNGAMLPAFNAASAGVDIADLVVTAYTEPAEFRESFGGRCYEKRREAAIYEIPTELEGVVESVDEEAVAAIAALETVHSVVVRLKPGMRIKPTVDLMSSVLRIFAVASDQGLMARDRAAARDLADRVYRLRAAQHGPQSVVTA